MSLTTLKSYKWTMLWALVIAILSLLPAKSISVWTWDELLQLDKLAHAIIYGGLFVIWTLERINSGIASKNYAIPLMACTAYGILLEILQSKMYLGRHFDVLDIIANIIGLLLAVWLTRMVFK